MGKRTARWLLPLLLLLLLFALLAFGSRHLSFTADEPLHIAAGYAVWAEGREGLWTMALRGHPLLINAWEALPLFVGQPDLPVAEMAGWGENGSAYSIALMPALGPVERSEMAARVPEMLLTILLAAVVFGWARDLWGWLPGLLATGALILDPTLLAHGRLATNDAGVAALGTLALYVGWRWRQRVGWGRAIATGMLLAMTMLSKASGALWALAFGAAAVWLGLAERRPLRYWLQAGAVLVTASFFLWGAYGFSVGRVPGLPFPLPAPLHWQALLMQGSSPARRIVFALGMRQQGNWWWYYPLAFLIKNPLPLVLGLLGSTILLLRHSRLSRRSLAIALFPLLYVLVLLRWGGNIGYRHLLPVQPFLYLLLAGGIRYWLRAGRAWQQWALAGLALWHIGGALWIFPNSIAFFNELVGGPREGYRFLVDSNVDWGQSFKELRDWLEENPGDVPFIAHMTLVDPALYGLDYEAIRPTRGGTAIVTPYNPPAGRYVIGATHLQEVVGHQDVPRSMRWFRYAAPVAQVGYSLFVYDVARYEGEWVAQCTTPTVPLTAEVVQLRFERDGVREVHFNCTQAWIYPSGGNTAGWYALHGDLLSADCWRQRLLYEPPLPNDGFVTRHLESSRFSYWQEEASYMPLFALYEAASPLSLPDTLSSYAAEATQPPVSLTSTPIDPPIDLDGPLAFMGAAIHPAQDGVEVETVWLVGEGMIEQPFSIMAHLVTPDGQTLGVADGLGISYAALIEGDVLVQRHSFSITPEGEIWLRTAAYWRDTVERWAVLQTPGADAIFVPLEEF